MSLTVTGSKSSISYLRQWSEREKQLFPLSLPLQHLTTPSTVLSVLGTAGKNRRLRALTESWHFSDKHVSVESNLSSVLADGIVEAGLLAPLTAFVL